MYSDYDLCDKCFDGPMCRHNAAVWDEPGITPDPTPSAPPPGDVSFTAEAAPELMRDPFAGLRSPLTKAARWATSSRIVKFCIQTGFKPWPRQAEILASVAASKARIVVLNLGRRSGKDEMAAEIALYEAVANADSHRAALQAGEPFVVALVGNSLDQAVDGLMVRLKRKLEHPRLAPLVQSQTRDSITLRTGAIIRAYPCNARSIRGAAIAVAIWTEAAHAMDTEGRAISSSEASEILSALLPATAQFSRGKVIVSSTPRWAQGVHFELVEAAADPMRPEVIGFTYATAEVNVNIPRSRYLEEAGRSWPEFQREYLAIVDADALSGVFDPEALRACVASRGDLPYVYGQSMIMSLDPAFRRDRFALVIGYLDARGRLVIVLVREWIPGRIPLDPEKVADEVRALWAAYGRPTVVTDQASAPLLVSQMRTRGVSVSDYAWSATSKALAVDRTTDRVWRKTLELSDNPALFRSLAGLERTRNPGGSQKFEAAKGAYPDDLADAVLGLVMEAAKGGGRVYSMPSPWR